jgi:DNA-directed RNA polymerase specialized sigma24 family protein
MEYQVIYLRQTEQKSNAEISALLGIGINSVTTLLSRARKKLLQEIIKKDKYDNR